jgi:archaemetzincin
VNVIHIVPLGTPAHELVERVREFLASSLPSTVVTEEALLHLDPFYNTSRGQYNSTAILSFLSQRYRSEDPEDRYVGILRHDLFIPVLTFVFGEAELGGRSAVVSYHRLENERYGLPANGRLLITRLCKEAMHEVGHTFGLVHCRTPGCVMSPSNDVQGVDNKSPHLCDLCNRQIPRTA